MKTEKEMTKILDAAVEDHEIGDGRDDETSAGGIFSLNAIMV